MTRRVVITGACGGLGRAMVAKFRAEGWHVVGMDRNEPDDGVHVDDFVLALLRRSHNNYEYYCWREE